MIEAGVSEIGRAESPLPLSDEGGHERLAGRIALVTGASRGIGRGTALALASRGVHCVLVARTLGGLEETDDLITRMTGRPATLLPLDVTHGAKVDALGPSLLERFGRLDVLVHGAGMLATPTPVAHIRDKDWDRALATNLGAAMRVMRTTTPLLRAAPAGRAVFLTNRDTAAPQPFRGLAATCRAGLEALVTAWQAEMADVPALSITLCDPGPTATRLRAQNFPGGDPAPLQTPEIAGERIAAFCVS